MESNRYPSLDIVRGLAALSVFAVHWGGWTHFGPPQNLGDRAVAAMQDWITFVWCAGGIYPGVIVFIVLSGFCIHLPLACKPQRRLEPGFWTIYAIRRVFRIGPVFVFGVVLGLLTTTLGLRFPMFRAEFDHQALNLAGIFFSLSGLAEIGRYFTGTDILYPGNGPLTSAGAEILLYAAYPLLLAGHRATGIAGVLAIGAASFGAVAGLRLAGVRPEFLHGTFFEFLLYWIFGAVSVECFVRFKAPSQRRAGLAVTAALGAAYLSIGHLVKIRGMHAAMTPLLAATTAAGLYAMTLAESEIGMRFDAMRRVLASLSDRSYSLFATHTPVLALTVLAIRRANQGPSPFLERWLGLIAALVATEVCYRLIEHPSHLLARRLGRTAKPPEPATTNTSQ